MGASSVNINEQQSADSPSLKLGDDAGSRWGAARHHSPPPRFWYNAPPPRREQSKCRYTNDFNSVHTRVLSVQSPPTPNGVSHDYSRLSCDIRWAGAHVFMPVRGRCLRAHVTLIPKKLSTQVNLPAVGGGLTGPRWSPFCLNSQPLP